MQTKDYCVHGAGLGLRRGLMTALESDRAQAYDFMELVPENWIGVGGRFGKRLRAFTERAPFVSHGLSLSIGGPDPLDETFLQRLRKFLDAHNILCYSEHLSYCTDDAHLYDLMPIPFTTEAVAHVAQRVVRVQDILGRRLALENVSFYTPLADEMTELEFLLAVLEAADCDLLLDVNNVYVNSINHNYDPKAFLDALPGERIAYAHIAGHEQEAPDLIVDTHGADVIDPVWELLSYAYGRFGPIPTLLERDFELPALSALYAELDQIKQRQDRINPSAMADAVSA